MTLEEAKKQLTEKNVMHTIMVVGPIGKKTHYAESYLMLDKAGRLRLGEPYVFCGSKKFFGHGIRSLKYSGIQEITCKKCALDSVNLDEKNAEYLDILQHLWEVI
jgi:hypothetical protein